MGALGALEERREARKARADLARQQAAARKSQRQKGVGAARLE